MEKTISEPVRGYLCSSILGNTRVKLGKDTPKDVGLLAPVDEYENKIYIVYPENMTDEDCKKISIDIYGRK